MSESELKRLFRDLSDRLPPQLRVDTERSIEELASIDINSLAQLEAYLNGPVDSSCLVAACHVAARISDPGLGSAVRRVFEKSKEPQVVWEAAKALVSLLGGVPPDSLLRWLEPGTDPLHQTAAAWAMGALGERSATGPLMTILNDRQLSADVRAHAAEALGSIGATEAIDLLSLQLSDSSPDVRYWSIYALAALHAVAARDSFHRLAEGDTGVTASGLRVADEARWALRQLNELP